MSAALSTVDRLYRARRIGMTFGRVYLGIKANQLLERSLRPPDMRRRWRRFNRSSAREIYRTAIELRGLILKGCQFIGARADVLPPEYVTELSKLQDRVPARPFAVVRRTVERELGRPLGDVYTEFSPSPIASASLAQVHRAKLPDGRTVAVKVQYPEIAALVRSDLSNLRLLFRAVDALESDVNVMPIVDELQNVVPRELDFVAEGHNSEKVAGFFADRKDVRIPQIVWEHSTERVLTMEFIEGIKISDVDALRAAGVDLAAVCQQLVEVFCEQILTRGFFHADPHPGNILVQPGPDGATLVLLDFGLAKELPPRFREGVVGLLGALLQGNADGMAAALVDLGFETRDGDPESLAEIARFFLEVAQQFRERANLDPEMVERVREELPEMIRKNPIVRIPGHLVLLGRVLGLLSGVSHALGSRVDLMRTLLPYVMQPRGDRPADV